MCDTTDVSGLGIYFQLSDCRITCIKGSDIQAMICIFEKVRYLDHGLNNGPLLGI